MDHKKPGNAPIVAHTHRLPLRFWIVPIVGQSVRRYKEKNVPEAFPGWRGGRGCADNGIMDQVDYQALPRGGFLLDTSEGYIQFGVPPETIKDTMGFPKGVPQVFILTDILFDWRKGISLAEIEFPLYFNFFIRKRKTRIICTMEQAKSMLPVLRESLFGPRKLDVARDCPKDTPPELVPNLAPEMAHFRNNLQLGDLVEILPFRRGRVEIGAVTVVRNDEASFTVTDGGKELARVPAHIHYTPSFKIGARLNEPYPPPLFSITCLGPSHGFDPTENTSGYIIWLNHTGIMVDPPVNSTEWLEASNVNPKLIDSIILTHCHADHDAGTFQKILNEGKVTVYTTETVMLSFLRKYAALSGETVRGLLKLVNFVPIKIRTPVFIHGGRFEFFYTLHSIPTLGFKMSYQDQSFVYSSDHNNDPSVHQKLFDQGTITKERYDELRNFPWDSKVIYHESGVPPLHTPIAWLNSLPEEIKRKIVVYHIAKKDFPAETSLKLATFGIENTLEFPTATPAYESTYGLLNILKHLDFFNTLPVYKIQDFITGVEREEFRRGDLIIKKGTVGDKFYIIHSGSVSVQSEGLAHRKIYGTYEYFGELALLTGQARGADIMAETDVVAWSLTRDRFLHFISGTEFEHTLQRLARTRSSDTWNLLSDSKFFQLCTSFQKTWLESILVPLDAVAPGTILAEGAPTERIWVIRQGTVRVSRQGGRDFEIGRGDFIGSPLKVAKGEPASHSYVNDRPVSFYTFERADIVAFVDKNPGIARKMYY
jgi:CRP-like cAMP-binding protein